MSDILGHCFGEGLKNAKLKSEICEEANVEAGILQENSDEHARAANERARKARRLPRQLAVVVREHDGSVTPDSIILLIPKDTAPG
jgi:hypothetical protein